MTNNSMTIKEAADFLGVSIDTLRRWDKSGRLRSVRNNEAKHRRYSLSGLEEFISANCVAMAKKWAKQAKGINPSGYFYCPDSYVFQGRLGKLKNALEKSFGENTLFSLLLAITGEIGDNSFAHNLGNWPDVVGIFFGYDAKTRVIVLADRGLGVLKTLKRVRPQIENSREALHVAFTEIISGRSPENRGNGLKYVRNLTENNPISLFFQSEDAELELTSYRKDLIIKNAKEPIKGCLAVIKFEI